ncbi:MAG: helix-turn-helix domain-containing protein [Asgard group archaeon]|nr:helix-turn-helix domain-containing protein [Asgard group archaeon]
MKKTIINTSKYSNIKSINILMIALVIHIFSVHSRLLYYMNPELKIKPSFSFIALNEPTILALVFAVAYSLATISVLRGTKKKWLIVIFAVMDSFGVLLYYFTTIPLQYGAVYFAVYTGTLILSAMYLNRPEYLADQIMEMKEKGISQRDIAKQLNLSESKISRLLSRMNEYSGVKVKTNGSQD